MQSWPLVGQVAKLQALARLGYDELRQLPLRAYITGGLYLSYPFNFMSRAIDPQHETTEYLCDFMDGDHLVKGRIGGH